METLHTIWSLFLFLGLLGVPQLLGVLVYFRVRKYNDFVAHFVGFLVPPLLFFYLAARIAFSSAARQAGADGAEVCGTFAGMMSLAILLGAGLQMIFGLMAQMMLHARHLKGAAAE